MGQHRTERPASPHLKNFTFLTKKFSVPGAALEFFAGYLRNKLNSSKLQRINWFLTDTEDPNRKKRATFQRIPMGHPRRSELKLFVVFLKFTSWL